MVFKRSYLFLNAKGQTAVEYIMLIAVVITLVTFVARSRIFQEYFGEEGQFAEVFRTQFEYTYRHGRNGRGAYSAPNYNDYNHDTYKSSSSSRFFGHIEAYPKD